MSFFSLITFSQSNQSTLIVDYTYHLMIATDYKIDSRLITNGSESLFEMDHTGKFRNEKKDSKREGNNFIIESNENEFVFKNFSDKIIHFEDLINFKYFHITSPIDSLFNWELKNEFKTILGYECQMAATNYGGRYYIAYFTTDLPVAISDGPWRFQGLPGLILEVTSIDNLFTLQATSISEIKINKKITNPLLEKESMTWPEFLRFYKKQYDATLRNSMTENGPSGSMPKRNIVTYIEEK